MASNLDPAANDATGDAGSRATKGMVYELSGESVDDFLGKNNIVLLAVIHPLLPRCQKLLVSLEKVADTLLDLGSTVRCAKVEAGARRGLMPDLGVTRLPTLLVSECGTAFKAYVGAFKEEDISAFVKRQSLPAIAAISDITTLKELCRTNNVVIVAYLDPDDVELNDSFAAVATDLRSEHVSGRVVGHEEIAEAERVPRHSIVVYNAAGEITVHVVRSSSSAAASTVREFIAASVRPIVAELLPETHHRYLEGSLPIGYVVTSSATQSRVAAEALLPLARKHLSRIQFCTAEIALFPDLPYTLNLAVDEGKWPIFAIMDPSRGKKFPLGPVSISSSSPEATKGIREGGEEKVGGDGEGSTVEEIGDGKAEIDSFVASFLSGKLAPTIKSAPTPRGNAPTSSAIREIFSLNYDDIVLDPGRDVLVEFYTPTCAPCRALLPQFERLARLYRGQTDKVVVAKVDFDANDVPDRDVRGFPWFKLYPAADKANPVVYAGERTVLAWAEFVREKGSFGIGLDMRGEQDTVEALGEGPSKD